MRSAQDLHYQAAQHPLETASGVPYELLRLRQDVASVASDAAPPEPVRPTTPEWLSQSKTEADELGLLNEAAARIRRARDSVHRQSRDGPQPAFGSMSAAECWEVVVAHAAREAARVSAQLAHIGLDIGSIAVVREKADGNRTINTLRVFFRDGDEVRSPGLVINGSRDGSISHGWVALDPEPGSLDLSRELTPQLRRLMLRLCHLVANGYANDAQLASRVSDANSPARRPDR